MICGDMRRDAVICGDMQRRMSRDVLTCCGLSAVWLAERTPIVTCIVPRAGQLHVARTRSRVGKRYLLFLENVEKDISCFLDLESESGKLKYPEWRFQLTVC